MDRRLEEDQEPLSPAAPPAPSNSTAAGTAPALSTPRLFGTIAPQQNQDPHFLLIPQEQTPTHHHHDDYVEELNSPASPFHALIHAPDDNIDRRSVSSSGRSSVASSTRRRRRHASPASRTSSSYTQRHTSSNSRDGDYHEEPVENGRRIPGSSDGDDDNDPVSEQNYLLQEQPKASTSVAPTSHVNFAHDTTPRLPRSSSVASRSSSFSFRGQQQLTYSTRHADPMSPVSISATSTSTNDNSHSAGWISGLSEIMSGISSRVVNTRSQENINRRSVHSLGSNQDLNDNGPQTRRRSSHGIEAGRTTANITSPTSPELPPWVRTARLSRSGSDSSNIFRRASVSGYTSSSSVGSLGMKPQRSGGSVSAPRRSSSQQGDASRALTHRSDAGSSASRGAPGRGLLQSSEPPKPASASVGIPSGGVSGDKSATGDEEAVLLPGGLLHRGDDTITLEGYSFKIFAPTNRLRQWLASILISKYTDPLILVVILAQWVFFVLTPTTSAAKNDFGSFWTHYALLAINILYTLEIIVKSIVYGLIYDNQGFTPLWWLQRLQSWTPTRWFRKKDADPSTLRPRRGSAASQTSVAHKQHNNSTEMKESAKTVPEANKAKRSNKTSSASGDNAPAHAPFFQSYYNRLDFVVVVSYWIDFTFMMTGVREIYIFKAISALRPLRLLSLTEGTATILYSLSVAAPLLLNILIFICFFLMILGLVGLLIFSGSLSRRCAIQSEDEPGVWEAVSPEVLCGGYYSNGTILGIVDYIGQGDGDDSSPRVTGMICPEGQICVQFPDYNPELGFVSFDNIFYSLLTVFTISSMEGWTDVEYWVMDADSKYAAIFFCVTIFLMSFLMIPLFIAGITYSFGAVRAEKRHSAFTSKSVKKRTLLDTEEGWQFEDQIRQVKSPIRMWFIRVVNDPWFPLVGAFLVFCDMLAMCFRRYDTTPSVSVLLDQVELAFTMVFLVEIMIRIAGHASFELFWKKKSNIADLILAVVTSIIFIPPIYHWRWYRYLTVFQVLRAYRLIPVIPPIRQMIVAILGSARGMMNLLLITFMFLLVCAPLPMILFGGDMKSNSDQPINFDDLGQSFISLFIILSGENWVEVMYEGLDAHRDVIQQAYGIIFFVGYYCLSHYVLLNLFIAIVLEQFELDDDEKYKKQLEMYFLRHQRKTDDDSTVVRRYFNPYSYLPARPQTLAVTGLPMDQTAIIRKSVFRHFMEGDNAMETSKDILSRPWMVIWYERIKKALFPTDAGVKPSTPPESPKVAEKPDPSDLKIINGQPRPPKPSGSKSDGATGLDGDLLKLTRGIQDPNARLNSSKTVETKSASSATRDDSFRAEAKEAELHEFLEAHPMYDRSLFLFPTNNRFRQWCKRLVGPRVSRNLVNMNRFNWFIFICIIISIVTVILDDPWKRREAAMTGNTRRRSTLIMLDNVTTFIFVAEQGLRIIAYGFLLTPTGYIRNFWNCLDLAITILSATMFFVEIDHLYSLSRAIRAMYCLRVLRIIRYFEGMSAMFLAITKALPKMIVALLLTAMLFWPFAIYGVNIYAGFFYLCNDETVANKAACVGEFMREVSGDENGDEILIPRVWSNPYDYSFDTIGSAILTLFEMASQEGWVSVLKSGRAVPNELGEQPFIQPDEPNRFNSFFFLLFMLVGSIIFVQIFIGVILETFKKWNGISLLTVEQRRWVDLRRQLRLIKPTATPERPKNKFRAWCFDMATAKKGVLWKIVTLTLVLNVLLIASQHYNQPSYLTDIQDISYFVFLGVYAGEIFIKIMGYGFRKWRHSRWNLYDMVITVLAIATLIPRFVRHALWTSRLEKFLLISISFRLAQRIDALQVLFRALVISMRSIINITGVFMVVMVIYAIMFRELFGMTRLGPSTTSLANFETFGSTMLMLIRMTTGENWGFVMHDMMVEPPFCTPSQQNYLDSDCGSKPWAYLMFLSFYIVCTYIMLNMFIAVIISNFSFAYQSDAIATLITREDLRNFKLTWAKFDPRGTGFIHPKDLSKFLRSLNGRLCLRVYESPELSISNLVAQYSVAPSAPFGDHRSSSFPNNNSGEGVPAASPSSPSLLQTTTAAVKRLSRVSGSPWVGGSPQPGGSPRLTGSGITEKTQKGLAAPPSDDTNEKQQQQQQQPYQARVELDVHCINMPALSIALSKVPPQVVHERRMTFNMVYTEAMANCTIRGIPFHAILDILSYTIVDIEQALGMDEFLKRNERIKEIRNELARETIHNLLQTIVLRRQFLRQRRTRQLGARLRPEVPRIVIDTSLGGNDRGLGGRGGGGEDRDEDTSPMLTSTSPSGQSSLFPSPVLDFTRGRNIFQVEEGSPIGGGGEGSSSPHSRASIDLASWNSQDVRDTGQGSGARGQGQGQQSPIPRHILPSVEGITWFNMLQEQIIEQDNYYYRGTKPQQ